MIEKIAITQGKHLESLIIKRNFLEKTSKITDKSIGTLSKNCPNLKHLTIDYSRKFEMDLAINLSLNLRNLEVLLLPNCPVIVDMSPLVTACPILAEVSLAGDSWVRKICLMGLSQHPNIKILHLGHFEHSDVECKDLLPPADELVENYCETA